MKDKAMQMAYAIQKSKEKKAKKMLGQKAHGKDC